MIAQLRSVLLAVIASAVGGAVGMSATDSYGWGGTLAGVAFAVVLLIGSRHRQAAAAVSDEGALTRAAAAGMSLTSLTATLVPALLLVSGAVTPVTTGLPVLIAGVLVAALTAVCLLSVPFLHGSTGVVVAVIVMLVGQLVGAGATTLTRSVIGAVLLGVGWGIGATAALSLRPGPGSWGTAVVVGATTALMGWLAVLTSPAAGILLPVLVLSAAMIGSIWAEVVPAASDVYLRGARRHR